MELEWRPVVGYENYYLVSILGNVKPILRMGTRGTILKAANKQGYKSVGLSVGNKRKHLAVHRLVAQAFIPNPDNKPCVNHIDGTRDNNHASNLEWCTHQENMNHMKMVLGRTKTAIGNPNYKRGKGLMYPSQQYKYLLSLTGYPVWAIRLDYMGVVLHKFLKYIKCENMKEWIVDYFDNCSFISKLNSESDARAAFLIYLINNETIKPSEIELFKGSTPRQVQNLKSI